MFELNLPENYFERLLGYELFTNEINAIGTKLDLQFNHPTELKIFYDILAKVYLNALDNRKYEIDLTPLFYLQLRDVRAEIDVLDAKPIKEFPNCPSAKYLSLRFADRIEILDRRLDLLVNYITRYQKQYFRESEEHKLIAFLDTMRMRTKPEWLTLFEKMVPKVLLAEPLSTRLLGPDVGQEVVVIRPYTISFEKQWNFQKTPVFRSRKKKVTGRLHFDMFLIRITDRYITADNVGVLDAEASYDNHLFTGEITSNIPKWGNVASWKLSHKDKSTGEVTKEEVPFYEICDLPRVNKIFGNPLSEYRLKTLMTDIEFQLAALG